MPLVTFNYHDFLSLLGDRLPKETLIEKLPMIGGDFSHVDGDEIFIEFFPNRPDLTSVEGIARASRAFFGFHTGLQTYPVQSSKVLLNVDPSVKKIRPYVRTALIKNITITNEIIISLMGLQEKLHGGLGRNRRKVAIGVHDAAPITPPFTYKAVDPDAVSFIPLGKQKPMTLREILDHHEKGKDYVHLLQRFDKYPLIVDAHNNVLSFPPIINGILTEVTPLTTSVFIDVTGTDEKAIHYALNIVTTALAERGGTIYSTLVRDRGKTYRSPDLTPCKQQVSIPYVNKILGTTFTTKQIISYLKKMGHTATSIKKDTITVGIPAWRSDILHEVDLVEDIAVGYGFDTFKPDFPTALTFGGTLPQNNLLENLRSIMIGLGFNEVTTFVISSEKDELQKMGLPKEPLVEIENPIGEDFNVLRRSLLPSLLKLLRENRHYPLPQQIFEVGIVVDADAKNRYHLAAVKIDAKAHFTECKALVEAVLRDSGLKCSLSEKKHAAFIEGRCASLIREGKEIGFFGELHPRIIQTFELEHPMIAFEILIDH